MRTHLKNVSIAATAVIVCAAPPAMAMTQRGTASDHDGTQSARGEPVDAHALSAAHRSLQFGTKVRGENLGNGRMTTVEINDRGPFTQNRLIDVSKATAQELGFVDGGVARVRISTVDGGGASAKCP